MLGTRGDPAGAPAKPRPTVNLTPLCLTDAQRAFILSQDLRTRKSFVNLKRRIYHS